MPKIIEGLREKIMETGKQILNGGDYAAFSVRGVAERCGVAVGTIYNYFPSKDMLIAEIIAEDWRHSLSTLDEDIRSSDSLGSALYGIALRLREFTERYIDFWTSAAGTGNPYTPGGKWHALFRGMISERVLESYSRHGACIKKETASVLSEMLISLGIHCDIDLPSAKELLDRLSQE